MNAWIPLPELTIVFILALLIFGPRTLWRLRRRPFRDWSHFSK
jgi:Sec-independent protein translocase protein TatA